MMRQARSAVGITMARALAHFLQSGSPQKPVEQHELPATPTCNVLHRIKDDRTAVGITRINVGSEPSDAITSHFEDIGKVILLEIETIELVVHFTYGPSF
jgi:hypothetical protein